MVRALPFDSETRIDVGRVAAIAAAIALHAAALLMLLMPMAAPQIAVVAKPYKPEVRIIDKERPKPVEVVPVVQQQVQPRQPTQAVPVPPTVTAPIVETAVIVDNGTVPAIDVAIEPAGDIAGPVVSGGPLPSATLEYVRAPAPRYPIAALRDRAEGTVMLRVLVDTDGTPIDVLIEKSSGNRDLDREARQHVLKTWRFKPAMQDGQAVQAYGLVPIDFTLQ
jgi:protein TonB